LIRQTLVRAGARARRWITTGRVDREGPASPGARAASTELGNWSDAELYAVWCATGTELLRAMHAVRSATAAEARQYLLAEIERRHPKETAAWLSSGSVLSGEPPRFLDPGAPGPGGPGRRHP
jgi:hypothetical protein